MLSKSRYVYVIIGYRLVWVFCQTIPISFLSIGTGFKLGPVTGEMLADMVTGRKTKYDTTPFLANRFHDKKNIQPNDRKDKIQSKI